ncbi:MAG: hypothetical protein K2X66_14055, partial [Cyanobacteria bacterium]|nr:hypothetical protein [Cyanobacteriota bacterium]
SKLNNSPQFSETVINSMGIKSLAFSGLNPPESSVSSGKTDSTEVKIKAQSVSDVGEALKTREGLDEKRPISKNPLHSRFKEALKASLIALGLVSGGLQIQSGIDQSKQSAQYVNDLKELDAKYRQAHSEFNRAQYPPSYYRYRSNLTDEEKQKMALVEAQYEQARKKAYDSGEAVRNQKLKISDADFSSNFHYFKGGFLFFLTGALGYLTVGGMLGRLKSGLKKRLLKQGKVHLQQTTQDQPVLEGLFKSIQKDCLTLSHLRHQARQKFPEVQALFQQLYPESKESSDLFQSPQSEAQILFQQFVDQVHLELVPNGENKTVKSVDFYQKVKELSQDTQKRGEYLPEMALLVSSLPEEDPYFFDEKRTYYGSPTSQDQIDLELKHLDAKMTEVQMKLANELIGYLPLEERFKAQQASFVALQKLAIKEPVREEDEKNSLEQLDVALARQNRRIEVLRKLIDTYASQQKQLQAAQIRLEILGEKDLFQGQDPEILEKLLAAEQKNPILLHLQNELKNSSGS